IRMQDKQGSVINPGSFLEVARKLRLDRQITRIMLDKCFATFSHQPCEFSINLSYADLIDDELSAFIRRRLEETGAGPRIIFEILESDGIENYQHARHFIDEVKAYGCRIAIDDFGTGYSNFEYLLRLDVDLIKIDGSLIRQLDSDTNAMILTQGIVNFAHSLGIATVAEYVHSAVIQERVVQLGIDFSQGEYIGMPTARPTAHLDSETC
ncbi:MAG: EAL domain-containing protein, partial [Spongiibacteraceae bacterium]|nr:EAL domain-containing protein [Spongiibacteraceae bacterium]